MSISTVSGEVVKNAVDASTLGDIYVLSPLQQEIFSQPGLAYRVEQSFQIIDNPLDTVIFERSWQLLVERHPILRTVFRQARKQPVQMVLKNGALPLAVHDLRAMSAEAQDIEVQRVAEEEAGLSFDLGNGPLFRLTLFRLAEARFATLLTFHPIMIDRRSAQLLESQAEAAYHHLRKDEAAPAEDAAPFKDFILWLSRQDSSEGLRYWQRCLEGFGTATPLPLDRNPVATGTRRTQRQISLPEEFTSALSELAQKRNVSVVTVLQAAWAVLLGRYSGETDVVVGLAVSGRPPGLKSIEEIVGPFENMVPVRVSLRPGQTVPELLHALQQQIINASHFSYLALGDIQANSKVRPPQKLFYTAVSAVEPNPALSTARDLTNIAGIKGSGGMPKDCELTLQIAKVRNLHVTISYAEGVFEASAGDGLLTAFQQILASLLANPEARVSELEIMPEEEKARVLDFGAGRLPNDQGLWVEELVAMGAHPHLGTRPDGTADDGYGEWNGGSRLADWLHAAWGSTEHCDNVTREIRKVAGREGRELVGVGKPISGTTVYLLDHELRLVPVGCKGKIALGGIFVGYGHVSSGSDSADPFVNDPYATEQNGKLYLTGDMGRWRWDGVLEILDPASTSVNGNGARPEAREMAPPEEDLTAEKKKQYVAPRTEIETSLATIWQEVLKVDHIGIHDDFFDLGGHSLTTIQIRSRISQQLGIDVPLRTIFEHTTLETQAKAVAALEQRPPQTDIAIPRIEDREYYPVSHAQRRLWFLHRLDPENRFYHTADWVVLEGALDRPAFERAVQALAERQAALRTSFTLLGDEPVQRISADVRLAVSFHDFSALAPAGLEASMRSLLSEIPNWLADLEVPPVRALLIKQAEHKHVFVLVLHHIISDEWSGQVVWRELMDFYGAACRRQSTRMPEVRVRYVDFAVWQNDRIERGMLAESEQYWLKQLGGELPTLKLPIDHQPVARPVLDVLDETIKSSAEMAGQLRQMGQVQEATTFMARLAVFKAFLSRLTGQEDILVGSTTAGRDHPDIEALVGLFVNVVALRTALNGNPSFVEILKRVKRCCVEAYVHQEYPFDLLVRRLAPVRESESLPILQAFFADIPPMKPQAVEGVWFKAVDASSESPGGVAGRRLPVSMGMVCHEQHDGSLVWHFLFRADLFSIQTAQRLSRQFAHFLADLVKHPNAPLFQLELGAELAAEAEEPRLERRATREEYPLAFNQRDMWFQRQIHDQPGLNNLAGQITLSGPLRQELFCQALQTVVDRHEALRTVFYDRDGVACQRVLPEVHVIFSIFDVSDRLPAERAQAVVEQEQQLVSVPFNFHEGPLFRVSLIRLEAAEHVVIFAFSHLILDGIYMAQLFEEVGAVYAQLLDGRPETPPPNQIQYPDFAAWQDERLKRGLLQKHEAYWHKQLEFPIPAMNLPCDGEARLVRSFTLGTVDWQVPDKVFREFKSFRKRYRTTVFRVVLATFEVLMQRVVGEKDLLFGVPFSSLPAGLSHLIGFFGHAVPVRVTLDDGQRFTDVMADVNRQLKEAQEHMEYPLCEAVRGLKINRDPYRPLFPVVISQIRNLDVSVGALRMRMGSRPVYAGVYHLWLTVLEGTDGLFLRFYYNRELLEGRPVELLTACMGELLSQVAAQPEAPIGELGILSSAERKKALDEYAGAGNSRPEENKDTVARFEEQASKRPQAVAAVCGSEELSYEELNRGANRLAHWLRAQGVGHEDRVGVFGARGLGMLMALLGILKAGAAFVPLDPEQPDARTRTILTQAAVKVLASDAGRVDRSQLLTSGMPSLKIICWDVLPAHVPIPNPVTWACQSASNVEYNRRLRDLAYVCHTSGSTGIPKGAMVEHRGLLNHLLAKIDFLTLDENSVVAQNASHCFDVSVWQFLAVLLAGGSLVIYPQEALFQPGSLLAAVERDHVTVLETVPSLLELMLNEAPDAAKLPRLRHLISNAELLPVPLCCHWMKRFPHVVLVNTYGATECSDDTTHQPLLHVTGSTVRVPVGRSIPGARHYVLDRELGTLPAGCTGQVAIAGDVVGRGYLGDAAATGQAFRPDPFSGDGSRLYLTGDLGRWNSLGELEFLGRTDTQVKLHGQRVELREIEAALARYPGLRQVAVMLLGEGRSQKVAAYWVGETGVNSSDLRAFSQKELPSHMVPNAFVELTVMPLTANGKIDRRMLPQPNNSEFAEFIPPRDEVEFTVARLWQEELGITDVGVFDNFFERGGHSLKAVKLINQLQIEFAINLPLRTMFDHQTIDSLSRAIRNLRANVTPTEAHTGCLVQLQPGDPSCLPLFLVHPHGGTVFCFQALATALGSEVPVFGIQCRGLEEGELPFTSIEEMACQYIKDIRRAQPQGPYRIAGWSLGGPVAFEVTRQMEASGLEVSFLGIFDSAIPSTTGVNLERFLPESAELEDFNPDMSVAAFARWFFRVEEHAFAGLSDEQSVNALRGMAERAGMLPPDVSPAMLKRFIAVAIRNGMALFQYRPAGPVRTDVVLFRAAQSLVENPEWWAPWTRGEVHTVPVAGSHYDMVFPPAVHVLAGALKERIGALVYASGD
ncbi:MAG TPA: amino acid adenylation domain-containing protein [Candidatus Angelobacter sp.]|nr:amino acid adenylation domain-containing protein [Candidatus Angelobacter sp.]